MTVQTEISRSGPYAGSGTTGPFTVGFRFLDNTHLQVIRTSTSGIDSTLVITTDYSVSGAGGASGTVTLVSALASGERLTIIRDVPFTQLADYVDNDAFPAESHENALDLLTMQTQQNQEELARALTLPATTSGVSTELPFPEANKFIGWNETGTALQNLDTGTLATIVAYGTANSDVFDGDGVTTQFVLSDNPGALNNLDVAVEGVTQTPGIDYTWSSGTTVTFTTPPVAGTDNVLVRYMQALSLGTGVASDIQYTPAGTGAVATTVQQQLRLTVFASNFGTLGSYAQNIVAIQSAIDSLGSAGGTVVIPDGWVYKADVSDPDPFIYKARVTILDNSDSQSSTIIKNGQLQSSAGANNVQILRAAQHPALILDSITTRYNATPATHPLQAVVTGSISGTTLTVSGVTSGTLEVGAIILGSGIAVGTIISSFTSGTLGGVGVYVVSKANTFGPGTITTRPWKEINTLDGAQIANTPSHPASILWRADSANTWQLAQDVTLTCDDHLTMYSLGDSAKGYAEKQVQTWLKNGYVIYGQMASGQLYTADYSHNFRGAVTSFENSSGNISIVLRKKDDTKRKIITLDTAADELQVLNTANTEFIFYLTNLGHGIFKRGVSGGAYTTVNRNALSVAAGDIGLMVFDSTLGKPVWLKNNTGPVWVDATGAAV